MSCLHACFRDRGPRTETEAMKRQNSIQEHEIIELREDNVEESETDHDEPPNVQTRKVGISLAHFILAVGKIPHSKRNDTLQEHLYGWFNLLFVGEGKVIHLKVKAENLLNIFLLFN